MTSSLRKSLIARFSDAVKQTLPNFRPYSGDASAIDQPTWSFETEAITFFVMLNLTRNGDSFAIEVGWSEDGSFPESNNSDGFKNLHVAKSRERLSFLWMKEKREYRWNVVPRMTSEDLSAKLLAQGRGDWDEVRRIDGKLKLSAAEAASRISGLVNDASGKLREFAIPLFKQLIELRGGSVSPIS